GSEAIVAIQHARPSTPTHWLLGSLSGLVVLAFGRVLLTEYALIGHLWSAADTYTSCLKSARGGPQADGELEAALPECLTFALGIQILAAAAALALGRGACVKRWVPWIAAHGILAGVLGLGADWSSLVGMRSGLLALGGLHKIDLIADIHDDYYFPFAFWSGGSFTLTLLLFWQLRWRWPSFGLLSMCCVPL
ncbi:MAG: hypothetical protein KC492_38180, partial [Myxococcales bacterium]|nr:hypothetical protein [Myxococcales bacterium]